LTSVFWSSTWLSPRLRKALFDGYRLRAAGGDLDNGPIAIRVAQLRAQRAAILGYASHAHYILETRMAKTPQGAENFLLRVWRPGLEQAKQERADMQAMIGDAHTFAAHDWWHYAEKLRKQRYAFDENATKPYLKLQNVRAGAFEMARRLFGVTFEPVDVRGWNPVVESFDVRNAEGEHLGLFMTDMYARDSKRGGAWMSSYRMASDIGGNAVRPIITNNQNLPLPPAVNDSEFAFLIGEAVLPLAEAHRPQAVVLQCGADALEDDPLSRLGLSNGARAGLTGFVAGVARQVADRGVTINGILPGPFDTDRLRSGIRFIAEKSGTAFETEFEERKKTNPAGRYGTPDEFAALCAFLCSAHAGYINGQNIVIDGGGYPGTL